MACYNAWEESDTEDAHHKTARTFITGFKGRIITTEYVLIEVGNWLPAVETERCLYR